MGVSAVSGNEMTETCHGGLDMGEEGNTHPAPGSFFSAWGTQEELSPRAILFVDIRHVAMR